MICITDLQAVSWALDGAPRGRLWCSLHRWWGCCRLPVLLGVCQIPALYIYLSRFILPLYLFSFSLLVCMCLYCPLSQPVCPSIGLSVCLSCPLRLSVRPFVLSVCLAVWAFIRYHTISLSLFFPFSHSSHMFYSHARPGTRISVRHAQPWQPPGLTTQLPGEAPWILLFSAAISVTSKHKVRCTKL